MIEVDGPSHKGPTYDAERQDLLEIMGLRVVRFTNDEVLRAIGDVVRRIEAAARGANPSP